MKPKFLSVASIAMAMAAVILHSCMSFKPEVNEINPAFGQYISAYTSGMVSRKTSIRIELAKGYHETHPLKYAPAFKDSAAAAIYYATHLASLPDSSLLENVLTFEPALDGKVTWINDRTIEFVPKELLPVNRFYNVKFKLGKLQEVPDEFETFRFQFSTYPQNLFVSIDGLRAYDDYAIEWQKLTGKLTTSDFEDTASVRKTLSVKQNTECEAKRKKPAGKYQLQLYQ